MKRFSVSVFVVVALLHLIVSGVLIHGALAASDPQSHPRDHMLLDEPYTSSEIRMWNTFLWVWDTLPMLLTFVRPLRTIHLVCFVILWSSFIGLCFGLLVPRVFTWPREIA